MMRTGVMLSLVITILAASASEAMAQQEKYSVKIPSRVPGVIKKVLVAEGTKVKKGALLVQLDDSLAVVEMKQALANITIAEAECAVCEASVDEAAVQYETTVALFKLNTASREEMAIKKLVYERFKSELKSKEAALKIVKLEYEKHKIIVSRHRITAPADGVVRKIYKRSVEAVAPFETVLELEINAAKKSKSGPKD